MTNSPESFAGQKPSARPRVITEIGRPVLDNALDESLRSLQERAAAGAQVTASPLLRYLPKQGIRNLLSLKEPALKFRYAEDSPGPQRLTNPADIIDGLAHSTRLDTKRILHPLERLAIIDWSVSEYAEDRAGIAIVVGDVKSLFYEDGFLIQGEKRTINNLSGINGNFRQLRSDYTMPEHAIMIAQIKGQPAAHAQQLARLALQSLPNYVNLGPISPVEKQL